MRVLHIYSKADNLIAQHVKLLADGMKQSLDEVIVADSTMNLRQLIPIFVDDAFGLVLVVLI